ncbi:pyridoxamine 5'-phosphate oxidase family protein [Nakamurella aerolata]|uniref:Pyridoxamine 5'-phosphate oxidase family protein n=1 Tax=Nakamurella aerolata TaxID=1656892 RepID=A0A849A543_9ACTN|nr:pyridoxamine 5'-phosphate oxidase family protein [Nakamurella aerolata]NNG36114.1 pyridoxamine 5'-phosphate oxidase family protein [Nakamurella aerolata]
MTVASPQIRRHPERAVTDRDRLYSIIDQALVGTLSTVTAATAQAGPQPLVVPVLIARDADRVLIHGSTGAGALRRAAEGAPVALSVTHLDALVVAGSLFNSSANYRSAVISGTAQRLSGDDALAALEVVSQTLLPGRGGEVRGHLPKEVAATLVLALPIVDGQWTAKARTGGPGDSGADAAPGTWRGVVPASTGWGTPVPADDCQADLPDSVAALVAATPAGTPGPAASRTA